MRNLFSPFSRFIAMDALFEGGRMFVGATSVAYLLHSGLGLVDIAFLKTIQSLVLILGEIPTGVFADSIGRKRSLALAIFCGLVGFLFFFLGQTLPAFIVAEALTALSLCFWSGAYEAFAIDSAGLLETPGLVDRFFHLNQSINSFAVLIFGGLGGWLGSYGLRMSYLGAISAFLLLGLLLAPINECAATHASGESRESLFQGMGRHLRIAIHEGFLHPALLPFFLANIGIQLVIQPLLHYWQPYFQSLGTDIGAIQLGTVFSTYCAASALAGLIYVRLSRQLLFRGVGATIVLLALFSALYLGLGFTSSWKISLIFFASIQALLSVSRTSLAARMNELIPNASRASILSSLSLVSRVGAIGALCILPSLGSPASMIKVFGSVSLGLVVMVIVGFSFKRSYYVSTKEIN